MIYIFMAMWAASVFLVIPNIAPYTNGLNIIKQTIIIAVVIAGAPCMLIVQGIEIILDTFLQEGWNDDDNDKFGY